MADQGQDTRRFVVVRTFPDGVRCRVSDVLHSLEAACHKRADLERRYYEVRARAIRDNWHDIPPDGVTHTVAPA